MAILSRQAAYLNREIKTVIHFTNNDLLVVVTNLLSISTALMVSQDVQREKINISVGESTGTVTQLI